MKKKAKAKRKTAGKVLLALLLLAAFAAAAVFVPNAVVKAGREKRIITIEEAAELEKADCILALGCRVYSNGSMSPMLRDRVQLALDVYRTGVSDKLLMSGDHGKTDYNEVQAMKDYLIENGVASSDVFMDHAGFSTYDSIYRAKAVFNAPLPPLPCALHSRKARYRGVRRGGGGLVRREHAPRTAGDPRAG